jgi:hypothetical protein
MTNDDSSDNVMDALPVRQEQPRQVCPHCGSDDLTKGLKLHADMDAGTLGVSYKSGKLLGMTTLGREQLYLDLCNSCGTVVRFFVKNVDRDWHR